MPFLPFSMSFYIQRSRAAAEHYRIEVKRNGIACCPFHDDRTPSMKVDDCFHCFGCQEDGDVIDFVGKLFGLSPKRAAKKLAEDFGARYESLQAWQPQRRPSAISKLAAQEYRKKENRCYRMLCEYCYLLCDWKERYAPQPEDEEFLLSKRQYEHMTVRHEHNVIAYQIRQSFIPGEVTSEEANRIGYELGMRFTKGKHAFIVATYTNRAHIHNRIIFNSTALNCTRKIRNFFLSGLALQRVSD